MANFTDLDAQGRAPNIFGYSRLCTYTPEQQIHIVAEYYANRIKAERIAYRTGIDVAFVKQLIAGEVRHEYFQRLLHFYRRRRRNKRIKQTQKLATGTERVEAQKLIEEEYLLSIANLK